MLIAVGTGSSNGGGSAALSDALGTALGSSAAGTSTLAARGDHVHPLPSVAEIGAATASHSHAVFTGDTGSGGSSGMIPAPAAGDGAAGKVLSASGAWVTPSSCGGSSCNVSQISTSLADTVATTVSCASDAAIVQVLMFAPGTTVVDTSLDFDASDEAMFIQEDAALGTDFVGGMVMLHGTSSGVPSAWSPTDKGPSVVVSNGNNTATGWGNFQGIRGGLGFMYGKHMFEVRADNASTSGRVKIGIGDSLASVGAAFCDTMHGVGYYDYGVIQHSQAATNGLTASNYTSGDYIQVAVDIDARSVSFYKNGVLQRALTFGTTLVGAVYPMACGYNSVNQVTFNAGPSFQYPINGYLPWSADTYPTTQPYFVSTSDNNHVGLANISVINSATIATTTPTGTSIKALVSFDGRMTWNKWDGLTWAVHSNGLADLQAGNTVAEITAGLANHLVTSGQSYLDFAFDLATTDAAATPTVDLISLNLSLLGHYEMAKMGPLGGSDQFGVQFEPGLVRVKNQSGASQLVKVNLLQ